MGRYYVNSIIVTVVSVAIILLLASMAGYSLSHLTFRGSRVAFLLILATMMVPFQVIMVPIIKVLSDMGLLDSYAGLIIAYVSQFLPFTVFFMTAYYSGIPKEITEAARVDGNGLFGVWGRIMLPIGRPALLSMGILNALFCWNDILIALLIMQSPGNRTVMVGVSALRGQYPDNVPDLPRRSPAGRAAARRRLHHLPASDHRRRHGRRDEGLASDERDARMPTDRLEVYIGPHGSHHGIGSSGYPVRELAAGDRAHPRPARARAGRVIWVFPGTYRIGETLVLGPEDSRTTIAALGDGEVVFDGSSGSPDGSSLGSRDAPSGRAPPPERGFVSLYVDGERRSVRAIRARASSGCCGQAGLDVRADFDGTLFDGSDRFDGGARRPARARRSGGGRGRRAALLGAGADADRDRSTARPASRLDAAQHLRAPRRRHQAVRALLARQRGRGLRRGPGRVVPRPLRRPHRRAAAALRAAARRVRSTTPSSRCRASSSSCGSRAMPQPGRSCAASGSKASRSAERASPTMPAARAPFGVREDELLPRDVDFAASVQGATEASAARELLRRAGLRVRRRRRRSASTATRSSSPTGAAATSSAAPTCGTSARARVRVRATPASRVAALLPRRTRSATARSTRGGRLYPNAVAVLFQHGADNVIAHNDDPRLLLHRDLGRLDMGLRAAARRRATTSRSTTSTTSARAGSTTPARSTCSESRPARAFAATTCTTCAAATTAAGASISTRARRTSSSRATWCTTAATRPSTSTTGARTPCATTSSRTAARARSPITKPEPHRPVHVPAQHRRRGGHSRVRRAAGPPRHPQPDARERPESLLGRDARRGGALRGERRLLRRDGVGIREGCDDVWRAAGRDRHSVFADPGFVDSALRDFRVRAGGPADELGIRVPDVSRAGPRPDSERTHPALGLTLPERAIQD